MVAWEGFVVLAVELNLMFLDELGNSRWIDLVLS
jgi:hypothetical protein